jgi:aromatic-L-amino-acid decarboxylase
MRYFGRQRITQMLRNHIRWAQRFAELVDADQRFERVAPAPFSVVCFRFKGTDEQNRAILDGVNATGRAFISHTALNGRVVLRMAIGNLATTWDDVAEAWRLTQHAAEELP